MELIIVLGLILFLFYSIYFSLMWMKSKDWKPLKNRGMECFEPSFSLVVPTYNEESTIVQKLRNLMEQDYPKMEIILVDSASEDRTVQLIERFVKDNSMTVKLITEKERKGKASALNGVLKKHCSGTIIVITDADAIWEKDALRKLASNFSDPTIGAATGRQILLNANQNLTTKLEKVYRSIFEVLRIGESSLDSTPIFNGPLMAFRSDLLNQFLKTPLLTIHTLRL